MRPINFILTLSILLLFSKDVLGFSDSPASVQFINEARKKAAEEGRLLFANFHAEWCAPCQWMDKNTYSSPMVSELLQQNYISVKINIDKEEGYFLKKTYDIKYLPTVLIFNSEGKLIDRVEETLSPIKMSEILTRHNTALNKMVIKHDLNQSPSLSNDFVSESMNKQSEAFKKHFMSKQVNKIFRVQIGVFTSYQQAEEMIKKLSELTEEPITVVTEYSNGNPVFKVRAGQFYTYDEARELKSKLMKDCGLDGIVI